MVMKKYFYILTLSAGVFFTGCYTQVATRDRSYTPDNRSQTYDDDRNYQDQDQNYAYDDSSEYYGDSYDSTYSDDSSDYDNNNYYSGSNSPYYYDDFYYSYPHYSRYFWGYYPSISIGFSWGWGGWYYDPFYYGNWCGYYYPSWCYSPYYYYYPYAYFGYNYYYGWGYPSRNYYTHTERTRDLSRIRSLDGMRGGGGRGILTTSLDRGKRSSITGR